MTQVQSVQIPFSVPTGKDVQGSHDGLADTTNGFPGVLAGLIGSDACGPIDLDDVQPGGNIEPAALAVEPPVDPTSDGGKLAAETGKLLPDDADGIDDEEAQAAVESLLAAMAALGVQEETVGDAAKLVFGAETASVPGSPVLGTGKDLPAHDAGGLQTPVGLADGLAGSSVPIAADLEVGTEQPFAVFDARLTDKGTEGDGSTAKPPVLAGGEYQTEVITEEVQPQGNAVTRHGQKSPDGVMVSGQISEPVAASGGIVSPSEPALQAVGEADVTMSEVKERGDAVLREATGVSDAAGAEVTMESEAERVQVGTGRAEDTLPRTKIHDRWSMAGEQPTEALLEAEKGALDRGTVERRETPSARNAKGEYGSLNSDHRITSATRHGNGMYRDLLRAELLDGEGVPNAVLADDGDGAVVARFVPDARADNDSMTVVVGGRDGTLHSAATRRNEQVNGQAVSAFGATGRTEQLATAEKAGAPEAEHPAQQHADRQAILDQVVRSARLHIERGATRFEMRMEPPRLGKVGVVMELRDGAMTISFRADTESVREILQNSLPQLKAALGAQGLNIDGLDVSASGHGRDGQANTDGRGVPGNGRDRTADDYRSHASLEDPVPSGSRRTGYVEFWA